MGLSLALACLDRPCDDVVQPFGVVELLLLVLACAVIIGLAVGLGRRAVEGSAAITAAVFTALVVVLAVWQMHHAEIPFGSDEAILLGVALLSTLGAAIARRRPSL